MVRSATIRADVRPDAMPSRRICDVRVEEGAVGAEAGEPVLEPLRRVGRLEHRELREHGLGAVDVAQRAELVEGEVVALDREVRHDPQHVAGDPVLDRQALLGHLARLAADPLRQRARGGATGGPGSSSRSS